MTPLHSALGPGQGQYFSEKNRNPTKNLYTILSLAWRQQFSFSKGQLISKGLRNLFSFIFRNNWRHQKDISKLIDLYFTLFWHLRPSSILYFSFHFESWYLYRKYENEKKIWILQEMKPGHYWDKIQTNLTCIFFFI